MVPTSAQHLRFTFAEFGTIEVDYLRSASKTGLLVYQFVTSFTVAEPGSTGHLTSLSLRHSGFRSLHCKCVLVSEKALG